MHQQQHTQSDASDKKFVLSEDEFTLSAAAFLYPIAVVKVWVQQNCTLAES